MSTPSNDFDAIFHRLKREKIQTPGPGQYVDRCHFSKTGWAIWNADGACTCKPAKAPTNEGETR